MIAAPIVNSKRRRILLADDDEDDRTNFMDAIGEVAPMLNVSTVHNGVSLMKTLLATGAPLPDLLFIDLNMPMKNGFECLEEIRRSSALTALPVIIYSTSSDPELISRTYLMGANFYIEKPQSYREIKIVIHRVLQMPREDFWPQPARDKFVLKAVV